MFLNLIYQKSLIHKGNLFYTVIGDAYAVLSHFFIHPCELALLFRQSIKMTNFVISDPWFIMKLLNT